MSTLGVVRSFAAVALVGASSTAIAADRAVQTSLGYSFVKHLEEYAGSAPIGAYLSLADTKHVAAELDLGWQRDSSYLGDAFVVLNTFTVTAGPRVRSEGRSPWFMHLLAGPRFDVIEGEFNTAWGGQTGAGVDLPLGGSLALRLAADFQIFFDKGESLNTLRLGVGVTF